MGCLDKACGAVVAVVIGVILWIGALVGLFLNESNAVKAFQSIGYVREHAITLGCLDVPTSGNVPYYKSCPLSGSPRSSILQGSVISGSGVYVPGFGLKQKAEIYQVVQQSCRSEDRDDNGCQCSYYSEWISASDAVSRSKCPSKCSQCKQNYLPSNPASDFTGAFQSATLGGNSLSTNFESDGRPQGVLSTSWGLACENVMFNQTSCSRLSSFSWQCGIGMSSDDFLYNPVASPNQPKNGDQRTSFLSCGAVGDSYSVIGGLTCTNGPSSCMWTTFTPPSPAYPIAWMLKGTSSVSEMCDKAYSNALGTLWGLRIGLWLLTIFAGLLIGTPAFVIPEAARVVPCVGGLIADLIENILCLACSVVSCLIGTIFSLIAIAIGWCAARPIIGYPLLGGAVFLIIVMVALIVMRKKAKPDNHYGPVNAPTGVAVDGGYEEPGRFSGYKDAGYNAGGSPYAGNGSGYGGAPQQGMPQSGYPTPGYAPGYPQQQPGYAPATGYPAPSAPGQYGAIGYGS